MGYNVDTSIARKTRRLLGKAWFPGDFLANPVIGYERQLGK